MKIHPQALVDPGVTIGKDTRVWAFAHVCAGATVGEDCNLCDHIFIEKGVSIGNRVTVKCGVYLWEGITIEDDVFVGPCVAFTNDAFPRSRQYPQEFAKTVVRQGASIGANATILPGITIGRRAMIGAGAVVTRDVPAYAIVKGNPARITGYVQDRKAAPPVALQVTLPKARMAGIGFVELTKATDLRGDLLVAELDRHVPFPVRRLFYVMNVPSHHVRGEHAHRQCHQLLVCLQGSLSVAADNGVDREEWVLDRPEIGLHIHPMTWAAQYKYSANAVLAVFASHSYDPKDYIRDYEEYLKALAAVKKQ
ncbi:MAG TPA: WxcM-like domain-containing protein [Verrucomicrobiae bacterium]